MCAPVFVIRDIKKAVGRMYLLCYGNAYFVFVNVHDISSEGTARFLLSVRHDISAVVDYPPLAVVFYHAVMTRTFNKVCLCKHRSVGVVVGIFCPFKLAKIIG